MRNAILQSTVTVLSLATGSIYGASTAANEQNPPLHMDQKQGEATFQNPPTSSGYNTALIFNPRGYANLYATGSFLFWKASADYLTDALLDVSDSEDPGSLENSIFRGKTANPNFTYKPGYQLGLGYKFHRDRWDLFAEYTRFHQKIHTSHQAPIPGHIHSTWLVYVNANLFGDEYISSSSDWNLKLDILDVELGRNFFVGRYLTFRPSLELRTLWLTQKFNVDYIGEEEPILFHSHNKSSSWGIGPRCALKSSWNLYGGLKIAGDLGVSLLHMEEYVSTIEHNPLLIPFIGNDISYQNKVKLNNVRPILDLSIGMEWGYPLFHDRCFFNLSAYYDYSMYLNQGAIQLGRAPLIVPGGPPFESVVGNVGNSLGNLSIQGPRFTARLDF